MSRHVHYQDIVNAPLLSAKRIGEMVLRLQDSLVEIKTISAIQEENYQRENLVLDKKLFEMSKNYDSELVLNDKLYKDLGLLTQRNKMLQQSIDNLKYEVKILTLKNDSLKDYKQRKRKAFKKWLKKKLKKRKVKKREKT